MLDHFHACDILQLCEKKIKIFNLLINRSGYPHCSLAINFRFPFEFFRQLVIIYTTYFNKNKIQHFAHQMRLCTSYHSVNKQPIISLNSINQFTFVIKMQYSLNYTFQVINFVPQFTTFIL